MDGPNLKSAGKRSYFHESGLKWTVAQSGRLEIKVDVFRLNLDGPNEPKDKSERFNNVKVGGLEF